MNACVSLYERDRDGGYVSEIRAMSDVNRKAARFKTVCHAVDWHKSTVVVLLPEFWNKHPPSYLKPTDGLSSHLKAQTSSNLLTLNFVKLFIMNTSEEEN